MVNKKNALLRTLEFTVITVLFIVFLFLHPLFAIETGWTSFNIPVEGLDSDSPDSTSQNNSEPDNSQTNIQNAAENNRVNVIPESEYSTSITLDLSGMITTQITMEDLVKYNAVSLSNNGQNVTGHPDIPLYRKWLIIPRGTTPEISVIPGTYLEYQNINIPPIQPPQVDSYDFPPEFTKSEKIYSNNTFYPSTFFEIKNFFIRGQSAAILTIYPFQFNPVEKSLRVYPDLRIDVSFTGQIEQLPKNLLSKNAPQPLKNLAANFNTVTLAQENANSQDTQTSIDSLTEENIPLEGLETNPIAQAETSGISGEADYLIITHSDFLTAANTMADWKKKSGFKTFVVTTDTAGSTETDIKTYITNAYNNWTTAPSYILLIGDSEYIPCFHDFLHHSDITLPAAYSSEMGEVGTDFNYGDIDDDYVSDIAVGRLPVNTLTEANNIVNRIINYEKSPPDPDTYPGYYTTTTHAAYFQDDDQNDGSDGSDGFADRRFAKTTEDMYQYFNSNGYTPKRIYTCKSAVSPTNWNSTTGHYSFENDGAGGVALANELKKPTFAWDGDKTDITNAVNSGTFLITHRDHGTRSMQELRLDDTQTGSWWDDNGWSDPEFYSDDVISLTNSGLPTIVFSLNCQTGWFDNETDRDSYKHWDGTITEDYHKTVPSHSTYESFCESWMTMSSGGALGVLGSTRNSYSGWNDRFAWGLMDAIWPDFIEDNSGTYGNSTPVYRMGDVINYAKNYMITQYSLSWTSTKTAVLEFVWFGDPAMEIRTKAPDSFVVSHTTAIYTDMSQNFTVNVKNQSLNQAVNSARVTVVNTETSADFWTGTTDASGNITFSGLQASQAGTFSVVVVASNYIPHESTITAGPVPKPNITSALLATDNSYVELTFDEPVYTLSDGTGILTKTDFLINFNANGGNSSSASITGLANSSGTALTEGESVIRVLISTVNPPSGLEQIEIKAATANSIYNSIGASVTTAETSGLITLKDKLSPSVSSVSGASADGIYDSGSTLSITVTFSETVAVTGTPILQLETGTTDQSATYSSGSNSSSLIFSYTVQTGDESIDLDYLSTNALQLNGGTIKDISTNNAILTLAAPGMSGSLAKASDIIIDGVAPNINSAAIAADNSYIDITFNEPVFTATGGSGAITPGDLNITFTKNSGNASNVQIGSLSSTSGSPLVGGESVIRVALNVTGAPSGAETIEIKPFSELSIYDIASNNLPATATTGNKNLGDTLIPSVVSLSSTNPDKRYKAGFAINVNVLFDDNVTVTGSPRLLLETGSTDRYAIYSSGSTSKTLAFTYTVQAGDISSDLDYKSTSSLELNSGTIRDISGNNAILTLAAPAASGSLGNASNIVIDTAFPLITSSNLVADNSYMDITFNDNLFNTASGTGGLETSDLALVFVKNGGVADNVIIQSLKTTFDQPLSGNETSIRVYLQITGTPNGSETIEIGPYDNASVFDPAGNSVPITVTTGATSLNDDLAPSITSVSSPNNNGPYKAGQSLFITVSFSDSVTVTGTPRILLETGATDRYAEYSSGSASSILTFAYTVQAGDISTDLDYASTSAFELNSGTIKDSSLNNAVLTLPLPGSPESLSGAKNFVIDTSGPQITGHVLSNDNAHIDITFDEGLYNTATGSGPLEVSDFTLVFLKNTGTATNVTITGISDTSDQALLGSEHTIRLTLALTGTADGNETIEIKPATGLSIYDTPGNSALATLTTGLINLNDMMAPYVVSIDSLTPDGTYKSGKLINIQVKFNDAINVTGTPRILLETGPTDRYATYSAGSNTNDISFEYTVIQDDTSPDLDYKNTTSLELNGGTLKDTNSNEALLSLPNTGGPTSLAGVRAIIIDTQSPVITSSSVAIDNSYIDLTLSEPVYSSANGTGALDSLDFQLSFSQNGGTATNAIISGLSNTTDLPLAGGETVVRVLLNLTGSANGNETIEVKPADNASVFDFPGNFCPVTQSTGQVQLSAANIPFINSVAAASPNGSYKAGSQILINTIFSTTVNVTGFPRLFLETGINDRYAEYTSGSGTNTLVFTYTVQADDSNIDLDYKTSTSLELNSGSIKSVESFTAVLTLPSPGQVDSLSASSDIVVDAVAPIISSVTMSASNSYADITFSEAVFNTSSSSGALEISDFNLVFTQNTGVATNAAVGNITNTSNQPLVGGETIIRAHLTIVGTPDGNETIQINPTDNTSIFDTLGTPGSAIAGSGPVNLNLITAPSVIMVASSSGNGNYPAGADISVVVTFSDVVIITGSPKILLETGTTDRYADYTSGTGSNSITFTYTVQPGDLSPDLSYGSTSAIELNSGSIKSNNNYNAIITLPAPGSANSLSDSADIVIDTSSPSITSFNLDSTNSWIDVTFSEGLFNTAAGSGSPETADFILLFNKNSGNADNVTIDSIVNQAGDPLVGGENIIRFMLSITGSPQGIETIEIKPVDSTSLFDTTGNNIPNTQTTGEVALNDTFAPLVTSIAFLSADGNYNDDDTITIALKFNEMVNVTPGGSGGPRILLETGTTDRYADHTSGNGTDTLTFTYIVQPGDTSTDLDCQSSASLELNTATINDQNFNPAILTLPSPGSPGSLSALNSIVIDTQAPAINNTLLSADNTWIDITFSEGIFNSSTGTGAAEIADFNLVFIKNTGNTSAVIISSITDTMGQTLMGNDTTIRINLNLTGVPNGDETIEITPASSSSLYDIAGNSLNIAESTGVVNLYDTLAPYVTSVTSSTLNGTYQAGQDIAVILNFTDMVTVIGSPRITLETGSIDRTALYSSGSGSAQLVFTYTVQPGDNNTDLDYISAQALDLNSGSIMDSNSNNAVTSLPAPGNANSLSFGAAIIIDASGPVISSAIISSNNTSVDITFNESAYSTDGSAGALDTDDLILVFSANDGTATGANLTGLITPSGDALSGGETVVRALITVSGKADGRETLTFTIPDNTSVFDALGNASLAATAKTVNLYDNYEPSVLSVSSPDNNGVYRDGTIALEVTFSEAVTVTGAPRIKLETGVTDRYAVYSTGSSTSVISFNYSIQLGDKSSDLSYFSSYALELDSSTIKDAANNNAILTLAAPSSAGSLSAQKNIAIDTEKPKIINSYLASNNSYIDVSFSEPVFSENSGSENSGSGIIASDDFRLVFKQNSGNATAVVISGVIKVSGDPLTGGESSYRLLLDLTGEPDGKEQIQIYIKDSLSVFDLAGNSASETETSGGKYLNDSYGPTVLSVFTPESDSVYTLGQTITILVKFNDTVNVAGLPKILLETGIEDRYANYVSGSGTDTLEFSYTVQQGDISEDLDYKSIVSLEFNGGIIIDSLNNSANTVLPSPGAENSLSYAANIIVDTIEPSIDNYVLSSDNSFVDIIFTESVFSKYDGTGAIETSDFVLIFNKNSGTATDCKLASVTNTSNSPLSGGETNIRIQLLVTGIASGTETITIAPVYPTAPNPNLGAIFDRAGIPIETGLLAGPITLNQINSANPPRIDPIIPSFYVESSTPFTLDLTNFEKDNEDGINGAKTLRWTIEDKGEFNVTNENSDNDRLIFTPPLDTFGEFTVKYVLTDSDGNRTEQAGIIHLLATASNRLNPVSVTSSLPGIPGYEEEKLIDNEIGYQSDYAAKYIPAETQSVTFDFDFSTDFLVTRLVFVNDGLYGCQKIDLFIEQTDEQTNGETTEYKLCETFEELSTEDNNISINNLHLAQVYSGKRLRVVCSDFVSASWLQLNEIEFYGKSFEPAEKITIDSINSSITPEISNGVDKLRDTVISTNNDFKVNNNNQSISITLDLGDKYPIHGIKNINDSLYGAQSVKISGASTENMTDFKLLGVKNNLTIVANNPGTDIIWFNAPFVRFIKLDYSNFNNSAMFQLNEIEVLGSNDNIPVSPDPVPQLITSSINPFSGFGTNKLVDDNINYNSDFAVRNNGNTLILTFDFNEDITFNTIQIFNDGEYGAGSVSIRTALAASPDSLTQSVVFSGMTVTPGTPSENKLVLDHTTARIVQMAFTNFINSTWFQLNEIDILTTEVVPPDDSDTKLQIMNITSSIDPWPGFNTDKLTDGAKKFNSDFAVNNNDLSTDLIIDFAVNTKVNKISIYNDGLYGAKKVELSYSTESNPELYFSLGTFNSLLADDALSTVNALRFEQIQARRIKIKCTEFYNENWFQLNEIEAQMSADPLLTFYPASQAFSSIDAWPGYGPEKTINRIMFYNSDFACRNFGQPVELTFDLGMDVPISSVTNYNDGLYGAKKVDISCAVSDLPDNFMHIGTFNNLKIADGSPVSNQLSIPKTTARYFKLSYSDFSNSSWFQINEVEFYGDSALTDAKALGYAPGLYSPVEIPLSIPVSIPIVNEPDTPLNQKVLIKFFHNDKKLMKMVSSDTIIKIIDKLSATLKIKSVSLVSCLFISSDFKKQNMLFSRDKILFHSSISDKLNNYFIIILSNKPFASENKLLSAGNKNVVCINCNGLTKMDNSFATQNSINEDSYTFIPLYSKNMNYTVSDSAFLFAQLLNLTDILSSYYNFDDTNSAKIIFEKIIPIIEQAAKTGISSYSENKNIIKRINKALLLISETLISKSICSISVESVSVGRDNKHIHTYKWNKYRISDQFKSINNHLIQIINTLLNICSNNYIDSER